MKTEDVLEHIRRLYLDAIDPRLDGRSRLGARKQVSQIAMEAEEALQKVAEQEPGWTKE